MGTQERFTPVNHESSDKHKEAEPFVGIKQTQLRHFLERFATEQNEEDRGTLSNLEAARTVVASINQFVKEEKDPELGEIDKRTIETFSAWVSSDWILPFTPIRKTPNSKLMKGVDRQSLYAYAALTWSLARDNSIKKNRGQRISRKLVLTQALAGLGEDELRKMIAVTPTEQAIFAARYDELCERLLEEDFSDEEEMATVFPERQQNVAEKAFQETEEKKKYTGTIPRMNDKALEELATLDVGRLERVKTMIETGEVRLDQGVLTRESYAAMYFITHYILKKFHEYDPYPQKVSQQEVMQLISDIQTILKSMQKQYPDSKIENTKDLYKGIAWNAEMDGLTWMEEKVDDKTSSAP